MANMQTLKKGEDRSLQHQDYSEPRCIVPQTDILENENGYLLLSDMPGVLPEDVNVQLEANELRIEAKYQGLDGNPAVYKRVFQVGPAIDPNGITAELKHGVLHLTAKKSEARRPRQIAVRAG